MNPGCALDALVAEKVMGWKSTGMLELSVTDEEPWLDENQCEKWCTPKYSTDIAAAWKVVEKFSSRFSMSRDALGWHANMTPFVGGDCIADTAPHAICLAALKAVGVEV